jgi:regulator of nucleoside diphosphate kinase
MLAIISLPRTNLCIVTRRPDNMRDRIYITDDDCERLRQLIAGRRGASSVDQKYLDVLEQELDRAEVVEPEAIPRDVVTMNSEVRLKDLDSGESRVYRLIFPTQTRTENSVSVLAPIGTAMLGYRVGDIIEWRVPKGIRRLNVLEVIYQPEAAGVSGD